MNPFRYESAADAASAVALCDESAEAAYLGGGTNLVDLMRLRVATPELLIDVSRLPYDRVEAVRDGVRIGGAARNADVAADPLIRERFPLLSQALLAGASGQIRNAATMAGNLLQRTRCVYFQDVSKPCNKREPGSGCPAREGHHRDLAIVGASPACVATHPSDMAVALVALGARVQVVGPRGERTLALHDLHRLPGDDPSLETTLGRGELITHVEVPDLPPGARSVYHKVRERASFAFALVSVAAVLAVEAGTVRHVAFTLGGVAAKPWRSRAAEALLLGRPPGTDVFTRAADALLEGSQPLRDNAFKVPLARRLLVQTLLDLAGADA